MKRSILFVIALLLLPMGAMAQDSMASFRALIEYSQPSATDIGGIVGPEIFSADHYPLLPAEGDEVTVRTLVGSYYSMVGYSITDVELTYWKNGGEKQTVKMQVQDAEQGIYSTKISGVKKGEEYFYGVRARDDWGNSAVEIFPDSAWNVLTEDEEDSAIDPSMDLLTIVASYMPNGELRLCSQVAEKPRKMLGQDVPAYGMMIFMRDVRYKPEQTETELNQAMLAAFLPYMSIADLVPGSELMSILDPSVKREKKAGFVQKGTRMCFSFDPTVIREDYQMGLKIIGITLAVNLDPFAIKPTDATNVAILYPRVHSFVVR